MPSYPGDPEPELLQTAFAAKDGYNDFRVKTGMHVGTHMDAPLHMLKNGKRLSEYLPEYFFRACTLIDARSKKIDASLLKSATVEKGSAVLVMTGWYETFGTSKYFESYPEVTRSFAEKIISLGVKIIGTDTPSPDRAPFSVHKLLLGNDVLIIENLTNLNALPKDAQFDLVALPAKFDTEAAPARVVAVLA